MCTRCKKALLEIEGVRSVRVIYEKKETYIEYEDDKTDAKEMIDAVDRLGFRAKLKEQ